MCEQQLGAATSPVAGHWAQLCHTIALGGCSASPPPRFATAPFILIPWSSVFSAALRHVCLGDVLHARSLKAMWVKVSAFRRARGSCYSSGSLWTFVLQRNPTNTQARLQGWQITAGKDSRSLETAPSASVATAEKAPRIQPSHVCFHRPGIQNHRLTDGRG